MHMQLPSGRGVSMSFLLSLIHLNHAALPLDSAAHRAAVTGRQSDGRQQPERDTQACSRRNKCTILEPPELAVQKSLCKRTRAPCVALSTRVHPPYPFTARSTRARQPAERTHVKGRPDSLPLLASVALSLSRRAAP
jgi:hypothetical protein